MALVKVTDANGNETHVPQRWLDHPELGKGFTPVGDASEAPSESWKKDRLEAYATRKGVDTTGKTKAEIVSALTENQE